MDSSVTKDDLSGVGISWWDLQMTWVNWGTWGPFLLSSCTDKMIPATGCKLFHSPPMPGNFARESCPSLNIGDRSRNLNLAPYHLEGRRSDFSPYWLCPTVLHFTGYTKTFLFSQWQRSVSCPVLWVLCPVPDPVCAQSWRWGLDPRGILHTKSPDRKLSNPWYSPALHPLLRYRISSWDSGKPPAVSQKHV